MNAELRQVANGCAYRVKSFGAYDVNGYRFHTTSHEQSRPNRRTTNSGVFTPGDDGFEYYGRIEEIYELTFHGSETLKPVIFKCHWFDPQAVIPRRRCLCCDSTGHTSLLLVIFMPNGRESQRLGCCV